MMAPTDDWDESDVLCQKHKSKLKLGFRVQTANLTKKELENLYYTMLDANIELKKTANAQEEQIKILNTKLYRFTALQKNLVTKEMSNNNFCCKSTKSLLEEKKLSIVSLKQENQRLSERIRVLNMRLCSNKQFMVRPSPMQSLQTVKSTKIISSTPNEKRLSFLNVPMQSFVVKYVNTGTNTTEDSCKHDKEPKEECSSHKCCVEMQIFKEDLENLQQELSKTQQEYIDRIAKLEVEMIKLHDDYIREKNEKKMTDLNLINQMKDNSDLNKRLRTAQLKCDELSMQLNIEKSRIAELTTQIKAAQISDDVSKAIENHYAEISLEPVIEAFDEKEFDDRRNAAAPDPTAELKDTQKEIATQWESGKQKRNSSGSSKNIKSKVNRRLSSSYKKLSITKVPSAIKSPIKHCCDEKPTSADIRKKIQSDLPIRTCIETTEIPEKVTLKNQDTQSIIPRNDIAIGNDKKIIPYQSSDVIEKIMDDSHVPLESNNSIASNHYQVATYNPVFIEISTNTTTERKKSYEYDFPPKDCILINEPATENDIKIKKELSLYQYPDNKSYNLELDDGDIKRKPSNQDDLLTEKKLTDESISQYFSDKGIASEINKGDQNLNSKHIPQKLNLETNIENPPENYSDTKNIIKYISTIFDDIIINLPDETPRNENKSNINKLVQVNESVSSIKSDVNGKSIRKRTRPELDDLLLIDVKDKSSINSSSENKKGIDSINYKLTNKSKEIAAESDIKLIKGNKTSEHNRKTSTDSKSSKRSVKINPHVSTRTRSGSLISLTATVTDKVREDKIEKFPGVTNVSIKSKTNTPEHNSNDAQEDAEPLIIGKQAYSVLEKDKNNSTATEKIENIKTIDAFQNNLPVVPTNTHAPPHSVIKKDYGKSIKKTYNASDLDNDSSKSKLINKRPKIVQRQERSAEIVTRNNDDAKRNTSPRTGKENPSIIGPKIAVNNIVVPHANQDNQFVVKSKISSNREQENESFTKSKTPPYKNVSSRTDQEKQSLTRSNTPPKRSVSSRTDQDSQSLVKQNTIPPRNNLTRRDQESESFSGSKTPPNKGPRTDKESRSFTRPTPPPTRIISPRPKQDNRSVEKPKPSPNRNVSPRRDQENYPFTRFKTPSNRNVSARANQDNQAIEKPKIPLNRNVSPRRDKENESFKKSRTPPSRVTSRTDQNSQSVNTKMSPNRNISPGKEQERSKTPPNRSIPSRTNQESQSMTRSKIPPQKILTSRSAQESTSLTRPKTPPKWNESPRMDKESPPMITPKSPNRKISPRTEQRSKPETSTAKNDRPQSNQENRPRTPPNINVSSRIDQANQSTMRPKTQTSKNIIAPNDRKTIAQSTPQKFNLLTGNNNSSKNIVRRSKQTMIKKVVMKPQPLPKTEVEASPNTSSVNEYVPMSRVPRNEFRNNKSGFGDDRNQGVQVEEMNNENLLNMIISLQQQVDELKSRTINDPRNTREPKLTQVPKIEPKRHEITVPVLKNVKDYDCIVVDPNENVILDIKHVNQGDPNSNPTTEQTPPADPLAYNVLNPEQNSMIEPVNNQIEQNNVASSSNDPYNKKHFEFDLTEQELLKHSEPVKDRRRPTMIPKMLPEKNVTGLGTSKLESDRTLQDLPQNHIKTDRENTRALREYMNADEFEKADQKISAAEKERRSLQLPRNFSGASLFEQKNTKEYSSIPKKNDKSNKKHVGVKVMDDEDKPAPKPPPPPGDGNAIPFPVNQEKYLRNASNWMEDKKEQKKGEGGAGGGAGQSTGQSSRGGGASKTHQQQQQEPDLCAHFIKICRCPKTPHKDVELFRTCSGTLRFKAYDPASGGFRRCECSKEDREGGGFRGGPDDSNAINMSSNRYAMHPSPVSNATENDFSSAAMNSRQNPSSLGYRSSSDGECDSTYAKSPSPATTPLTSPHDQTSEGEVKNSGERAVKVQTVQPNALQTGNDNDSESVRITLQRISAELAKCNRLLTYQKYNAEHPATLNRNASVQVRTTSVNPEGVKRSESVVVSYVPKCVFTIYIGSMVLSDEAVLQASTKDLVLMWKFYDQSIAMTEITPGRRIQLHSSSTYDIKLTDEFFEYMKKNEVKIVLCQLNDPEHVFGYCYLPLRDALINTNRRVDMSLALIAGPKVIVESTNPEFEIGVIDLWCHLQVQQKYQPYFNEAISRVSTFAQGSGRPAIDNNLNKTIVPKQKDKKNKRTSDDVCSEDLEILSDAKRKRWIQQNDMKSKRLSDSSSQARMEMCLKPSSTGVVPVQDRFKEQLGKEITDGESGSMYKSKTTSTRELGKSFDHGKLDFDINELMVNRRSNVSSNLGLLNENVEKDRVLANEVPTKVKTLSEIETFVEQGSRRDSTTSLKITKFPLENLNEQWKYYDQLPERDTASEKTPKDKKHVNIDEAKQHGLGYSESVDITILWLALSEESPVMNDNAIQRLFVAYSFLGKSGAELETPISLPKPKHQLDKCHFNFLKSFAVSIPAEYRQIGHLGKCFQRDQYEHNSNDCITFSVVNEPNEDPLGLANCEDIGYAYLYLGDLIQFSAGGDTYTEVTPILYAKNPKTVLGVLAIKVDGLNFVRKRIIVFIIFVVRQKTQIKGPALPNIS